jgi:hypothetical protein
MVIIDGVSLEIGFIYHLQIVTTSNCNIIVNLHTLQITTAHAKPSHSASNSRFPVTDLKNGDIFSFCNHVVIVRRTSHNRKLHRLTYN